MTTRRTTNRNVARTADKNVQPGSTNIILLARRMTKRRNRIRSLLKPRPVPRRGIDP
jgi:hypothetical protein